jgi:hypothetical protein
MGDRSVWLPTLICGIVASVVGGIAVYHYTTWFSGPPKSIPAAATGVSATRTGVQPVDAATNKGAGCVYNTTSRIANIEQLSYSSEKDDRYGSLINELISCGDYSAAFDLVPRRAYSSEREDAYKKIVEAAVQSKDLEFAQKTVDKLSYTSDKDKYRKLIIDAR